MSSKPFISAIIPCRNEEKFISKCLASIVASTYPKDKLEVLVVDGMSEDETRNLANRFTSSHAYIRLLENPKKIYPAALNIGIKSSRGRLVMILGAHATYDKDYFSKCVDYSDQYQADNVGGGILTLQRKTNLIGKAVTLVLSSRFGVGNSAFRTGTNRPLWVDTVFGGCYRREVFEKIGYFNEDLISSSDMEFNLRLKRAGGKTLLAPDIISHYYTRSDFTSFVKNNFRNGLWAVLPFKFSKIIPVSFRHLIPLAFVSSLLGSLFLSFFDPIFLYLFLLILVFYGLAVVFFSFLIAKRERDIRIFLLLPLIFSALHIFYGIGSLVGLARILFSRRFWKLRLCA